jgi:hypothetical protein
MAAVEFLAPGFVGPVIAEFALRYTFLAGEPLVNREWSKNWAENRQISSKHAAKRPVLILGYFFGW